MAFWRPPGNSWDHISKYHFLKAGTDFYHSLPEWVSSRVCCDMGRFCIGSGISSEVYHMIWEAYSYLSTKTMTFPDPSNAKVPALCLVNTINKGIQHRPHEDLWALGQ